MSYGLDFVDLENPKVRPPTVRLEEWIMIGTEMSRYALPMNGGVEQTAHVGAVTGAPPFVTIGAFTFLALATTASRSRTSHFIIGAPESWMSGCLFV